MPQHNTTRIESSIRTRRRADLGHSSLTISLEGRAVLHKSRCDQLRFQHGIEIGAFMTPTHDEMCFLGGTGIVDRVVVDSFTGESKGVSRNLNLTRGFKATQCSRSAHGAGSLVDFRKSEEWRCWDDSGPVKRLIVRNLGLE